MLIGHLYTFLDKYLLKCLSHLLSGLSFYYWVIIVLYIFWTQTELKPLSNFANTFSHSLDCLFTFLVSSEAEKVSNFDEVKFTFFFFFFCCLGFWCHTKKLLPNSRSQRFTPMFFPKSFIVLTLWFRSLIHFELILGLTWGRSPSSFFWRWISSCARILCPSNYPGSLKSTWSLTVTVVTYCMCLPKLIELYAKNFTVCK